MVKSFRFFLLLVVCCGLAGVAQAGIIIGVQNDGGATPEVVAGDTNVPGHAIAVSWTIGQPLSNWEVAIWNLYGGPAGADFQVHMWRQEAGVTPADSLVAPSPVNLPTIGGGAYAPAENIFHGAWLEPGTYFLLVSARGSNSGAWAGDTMPAKPVYNPFQLKEYHAFPVYTDGEFLSLDLNATAATFSTEEPEFPGIDYWKSVGYSVTAENVAPEPATFLILGGGLLALGYLRRRRRA